MYEAVPLFLFPLNVTLLRSMCSALLPLRRLGSVLTVFHRFLLRFVNPKFIRLRAALSGIMRRLALWNFPLCSMLNYRTQIHKSPDKDIDKSSDDDKTAQQDLLAYTIVRNGEIVPLNGTAQSLHPYSSPGIRGSQVSARSERPRTPNSSRNRESDTISFTGSAWELSLNPVGPPSRPASRLSALGRPLSNSSLDLNGSTHHRKNSGHSSRLSHRSPPPGIGIELAVPEPRYTARDSDDSNVHVRPSLQIDSLIISEQLTNSSPRPSPPAIQIEATSPTEASSFANLSRISLNISNDTNDGVSQRSISPFVCDASSSRSRVALDTTSQISDPEVHIIKAVLPEDSRRYSRRTRM